MGRFKQWTTTGGGEYFPAGDVVKQLPAGYYAIKEGMMGTYFKQKPAKSEDLIRFPDADSDAVVEEIENFWNMEGKFRESNIPYKRGLMLYGPPGSGKTCTLRIVVDNLVKERDGMVIDFPGSYLFKEGYEVFRDIHPEMPLVVLMEDIDVILNRGNESEVLNLLDGMYDIDKTIFVATTNYPENISSRVMNRPSRFDKKFFIGMPSTEAREIYIRTKLTEDSDDVIDQWVVDTEGFSIAHIKELFVANKILGDPYDVALETLSSMKSTPISSSFDDYRLTEDMDEAEVGPAYVKYRNMCESAWDEFGTGGVYKRARRGPVITEGNLPSPSDIAKIIPEDLY